MRGRRPGSLFHRHNYVGYHPTKMTVGSIYVMVVELGRLAGLSRPISPLDLREHGIARAREVCGGNERLVRKFSRNPKPRPALIHGRKGRDFAGDIARLISE
jgi:hypothetical protein